MSTFGPLRFLRNLVCAKRFPLISLSYVAKYFVNITVESDLVNEKITELMIKDCFL